MRILKPLPFFLLIPLLCTGCDAIDGGKPLLVASFYPLSEAVAAIAGTKFEVKNLTPPGQEPHDVEIGVGMRKDLERAKAIFVNGLGMEPWGDALTLGLKAKTVTLSDGLETLDLEGRIDPHVWLDTRNYAKMGETALRSIVSLDKGNEAYYTANFLSWKARVLELEQECSAIASSFKKGKVIAVNHAAFGYLCAQWGIRQLYINRLSPDEEPTQAAINALLDAVREYGIDTIFFEELASDQIARYIASATGAKCESLNPLEGLEEEDIEAGEDYFSVYRENMTKIAEAKP